MVNLKKMLKIIRSLRHPLSFYFLSPFFGVVDPSPKSVFSLTDLVHVPQMNFDLTDFLKKFQAKLTQQTTMNLKKKERFNNLL